MAVEERSSQRLARWCASSGEVSAFGVGLLDRMGGLIGFDGAFLAVVDPATLLYTQAFRQGMPFEASAAFLAAELGPDDVNQLRQLVRQSSPVGWLDKATAGNRAEAARYRLAMRPFGLGDELRVALVADGLCWGLLCLHRAAAKVGFEAADATRIAAVAPWIAGALRRVLLTERAAVSRTIDGPGVSLLNSDRSVASSTPAAAYWLAELRELEASDAEGLPTAVSSVVERLLGGGGPADARVLAPSGQWLTISASHLDDAARSVAVIIEPASPLALAPLIVSSYGLTPREHDVTRLLLTGTARKAIAAELHISPHTVNDHVKAVFDKTGVSSAGELRARLLRLGPAQPPR